MQLGQPHWHHAPPANVRPASAMPITGEELAGLLGSEGEKRSGKEIMQTAANSNLILTGCSSYAGFVSSEIRSSRRIPLSQSLFSGLAYTVHSRQAFEKFTRRLIKVAEQAYSLRDMKTVEEAGQILMNLPMDSARQIGLYYQALAFKRNGKIDEARILLQTVADKAPVGYRVRAMQTMASIYHNRGKLDETFLFCIEASRLASSEDNYDWVAKLIVHLNLSLIKSDKGAHNESLAYLENLLPLVRITARQSPLYYYFYHADLAYELAQVGHIQEAEAVIAVALNSPFAAAYAEWSETRDEIVVKRQAATRSHSQVAIERALQPKPTPKSECKPKIAITFGLLICKRDYLQAGTSIIATAIIVHASIPRLIVKRIHRCFDPRSPPGLSRVNIHLFKDHNSKLNHHW